MIPRLPASPWLPRAALALGLALLGLTGCQDRSADGGTTDGTSTVAFYLPDGKPAAGARVQVYASSDTTRIPRAQAFTDAQGRVSLPVLDSSLYNLVARDESGRAMFQDSLLSDGRTMDYASDTLVGTGVVTGRVRVQPQHDPRIVWIALLGAGTYLNVDDSGRFRIEGVPEGKFTLGGFTKTDGYTTTFKALRVKRDSTSDIGVLDMVFTGLPVVKNLEARFDTLAGLVHLRWDSIPLRETWRYTVRRDGMKVGETIGSSWIDTVSDEYPKDVPSEGRHSYQVVVSDARVPGPVWETIEMRIISAYLYQEVKVDWVRKAALPWKGGVFQVDTLDGTLVAWRSAKDGSLVRLPGESDMRWVDHKGYVSKWTSADSGASWTMEAESLGLGALPARFQGRWWSVRRAEGPLRIIGSSAGLVYDSLVVLSSGDGIRWDSVATLQPDQGVQQPLVEADGSRLWVSGARIQNYSFRDEEWWSMGKDRNAGFRKEWGSWQERSTASGRGPNRFAGISVAREYWDGLEWIHVGFTLRTWAFEGRELSMQFNGMSFDPDRVPRLLRVSPEKVLLFDPEIGSGPTSSAYSMDTTLSEVHALSWPGGGFHRELLWGGRILSISDSGVYLGRILSGVEGGDPRGTWVKKTETPRVF